MNQKTALERIGVSRKTFIKYRKEAGMFEETKKEITEEQLAKLITIRDKKKNTTYYTRVQFEERAAQKAGIDVIPIEPTDTLQIRKLKEQYNRYAKFIDIIGTEVIDRAIAAHQLPPKDYTALLEKYQGLQLRISKELRHAQQNGNDIGALIAEKLKAYG